MSSKSIVFKPFFKWLQELNTHPKPSKNFIPTWFKDMSQTVPASVAPYVTLTNTTGTMKRCVPSLDALTLGYTISLPADIEVIWDPFKETHTITWTIPAEEGLVSKHGMEQTVGMPVPEGFHPFPWKWYNHWGVETPKGYSCLLVHPLLRFDLPFMTLPAVVDTDTYQGAIQNPFLLKKGWSGVIESGTPIIQVFPFKREDWDSTYAKFNPEAIFTATQKTRQKIVRSYQRQFWSKKNFN
jgi:hypothetical protein